MDDRGELVGLDEPWSMGVEDYKTLARHLDPEMDGVILELGSGASTIQLARDFPNARVIALESNEVIGCVNQSALGELSGRIVFAQERMQFSKGAIFSTYDFRKVPASVIDVLLIDGPVEREFPMGREGAMYILFDMLAIGALIGLDDYHRLTAKRAVERWLRMYGDCVVKVEETESYVVLRKVAVCSKRMLPLAIMARSYLGLAQGFVRRAIFALKSGSSRGDA